MPAPLWIMLGSVFAIMLPAPILISIFFLLLPGRKGRMRTERNFAHDGMSVEQAKTLYAARLQHEGFTIQDAPELTQLNALRKRKPITETHTHSDKTVAVEMRFTPDDRGVRGQVAAWLKDFVFYDTGEGRYVDLILDRLLKSDLDQEPEPVVPTHSSVAISTLGMAVLGIAVILYMWFKVSSTTINTAAIFAGAVLSCLATLLMARESIKQIRARPLELTGMGTVIAAIILAAAGLVGGAAMLWMRFGPTIAEFFKQEFERRQL
jgi:hypothetical protein